MDEGVKISFGKTLQKLRKEKNLTQESLAYKCQVERAFVSRLERALVQPTLATIVKLANGLNTDPSKLVEEFEKEFQESQTTNN